MPDNVIWSGPEHGDGDHLARAFRRITGRDFEPGRCQWEEIRGDSSVFHYRDGWEVAVGPDGACSISRDPGKGGGA